MLTPEDLDIIQGAVNSIIFVKTGLTEEDSDQRDLLDQSIVSLRTLIVTHRHNSTGS
jgi:hypothetical protein